MLPSDSNKIFNVALRRKSLPTPEVEYVAGLFVGAVCAALATSTRVVPRRLVSATVKRSVSLRGEAT